MKLWYVYMLRCADDSLYTGITTDTVRRLQEHNDSTRSIGAKYTRSRQPVTLVYVEQYSSRSEASAREFVLKNLSRTEKLRFLAEH